MQHHEHLFAAPPPQSQRTTPVPPNKAGAFLDAVCPSPQLWAIRFQLLASVTKSLLSWTWAKTSQWLRLLMMMVVQLLVLLVVVVLFVLHQFAINTGLDYLQTHAAFGDWLQRVDPYGFFNITLV